MEVKTMRVMNCGKWINVVDLPDASHIIRETIEHHYMSSNHWYGFKRNGYCYEGDELIAKISYNGRIWMEGELECVLKNSNIAI
jgi:hypothetical protein